MAYHQGKYNVKDPSKYKGNARDVVYRSSWEKACFMWLDKHPAVIEWNSEEVVIPYLYEADKKYHRYFMDLYIKFKDRTILVEVKPFKETKPPTKQGKKKQRYITEAYTFVKNQNKWQAAQNYCLDRGWGFEIWTERELSKLGILNLSKPSPFKPLKKLAPYKKKKSKK